MIITITDFIFQGKCCYIIHKNQCIKMSCHWWKHIINSVMPLWDLLKWVFSVTPDSYFSSFPPKNMRFQTAGMAWPEAQLWPVSRRSERWTMTNVEEKKPLRTSEPPTQLHACTHIHHQEWCPLTVPSILTHTTANSYTHPTPTSLNASLAPAFCHGGWFRPLDELFLRTLGSEVVAGLEVGGW